MRQPLSRFSFCFYKITKKLFIKLQKMIDKRRSVCYTSFIRDRGALHDEYRTKKAAGAMWEGRGCRSGCCGGHLSWQLGEDPFCCRNFLRRAIRGILFGERFFRFLYFCVGWLVHCLHAEPPFLFSRRVITEKINLYI